MNMLKNEDNLAHLDSFYIVDFDRTIINSDKMFEIFVEIARTFIDIPTHQIESAEWEIKQTGDSFDTAGYVKECLNREGRRDAWDDLEKIYIHESRALNYMLPGAAELLQWLDSEKKEFGILTYGNPLWQHVKLTASGFNHIKHIVIEQKEKGKFIRSWMNGAEMFNVPEAFGGHVARAIVMIDDKAVSFAEFPREPSSGYWVLDPENELPSQQGIVPKNVLRCESLYSVLESLRLKE